MNYLTADQDHTEQEKEELERLIKKLIINKETPIYRNFFVKGDRETLDELTKTYKDFILANKTAFFGNPPYSVDIQGYLNKVDRDWRKGGRRTRNRKRRTRKHKSKRY